MGPQRNKFCFLGSCMNLNYHHTLGKLISLMPILNPNVGSHELERYLRA